MDSSGLHPSKWLGTANSEQRKAELHSGVGRRGREGVNGRRGEGEEREREGERGKERERERDQRDYQA